MNSYFRIDVNLLAALMLAVILFIAYGRLDRRDRLNRAFLVTSLIVILQLVVEALTCLLNGMPGDWVRPVALFLHVVLFIAAPGLTYSWYRLSRHVGGSFQPLPKPMSLLMLLPFCVSVVFSVLSSWNGLYFDIDSMNVYVRGPWFGLSAAMTYFYLIATLGKIVIDRKRYMKEDLVLMTTATVMPMVGGVLQSLFYGILLMWSSVAFSLLVVFIFLEQRFIRVDRLTGARTRDSFEYHVKRRLKHPASFGLVYLDLDSLKAINDRYGHDEGDCALRAVADAVKSVIGKDDYVVRLGGNEFVAFVDNVDREALARTVERAKDVIDAYNAAAGKPYRIAVSVGYDVRSDRYSEIEDFIRHVDHLMYRDKQNRHASADSGATR